MHSKLRPTVHYDVKNQVQINRTIVTKTTINSTTITITADTRLLFTLKAYQRIAQAECP